MEDFHVAAVRFSRFVSSCSLFFGRCSALTPLRLPFSPPFKNTPFFHSSKRTLPSREKR